MTVWLATEIWPAQDAGPRIPWRHRPASGRAARRGLSKVGFHEGHSAIGPARLAGASGPPRGTRAPDDGRPADRQGQRASSVGPVAIPGRSQGGEIGRANVCTSVTNAHRVFRILL